MKKRAVLLAATAILVLLVAVYLWGPLVPPGQEPLATLTSANFNEFENAFDREADAPRLMLLLSPT